MALTTTKKVILLLCMAMLNSGLVLVAHRSFMEQGEGSYNVNHMLLVAELGKFGLSCMCEYVGVSRQRCDTPFWTRFIRGLSPKNVWKLQVPAALYFIQNYLAYLALANIPAPVFQVTYQAKLVAAAIVSVMTFKDRTYSTQQWISIVTLSVGVAIVAADGVHFSSTEKEDKNWSDFGENCEPSFVLGISSAGMSCIVGAFAGVFFEWVVKKPPEEHKELPSTTSENDGKPNSITAKPLPVSLWVWNAQLAFFSIVVMLARFMLSTSWHGRGVQLDSFLEGFNRWVWLLVAMKSVQSIFIAAVLKYADNVLKGIATALGVCFTTAASSFVFGTHVGTLFFSGSTMVIVSAISFSNPISVTILPKRNVFTTPHIPAAIAALITWAVLTTAVLATILTTMTRSTISPSSVNHENIYAFRFRNDTKVSHSNTIFDTNLTDHITEQSQILTPRNMNDGYFYDLQKHGGNCPGRLDRCTVRYFQTLEQINRSNVTRRCSDIMDVLEYLTSEMDTSNKTMILYWGSLIKILRENSFFNKDGTPMDDDIDFLVTYEAFDLLIGMESFIWEQFGWLLRIFLNCDGRSVFAQMVPVCGHKPLDLCAKSFQSQPSIEFYVMHEFGDGAIDIMWARWFQPMYLLSPVRNHPLHLNKNRGTIYFQIPNFAEIILTCAYGNWSIYSEGHSQPKDLFDRCIVQHSRQLGYYKETNALMDKYRQV